MNGHSGCTTSSFLSKTSFDYKQETVKKPVFSNSSVGITECLNCGAIYGIGTVSLLYSECHLKLFLNKWRFVCRAVGQITVNVTGLLSISDVCINAGHLKRQVGKFKSRMSGNKE